MLAHYRKLRRLHSGRHYLARAMLLFLLGCLPFAIAFAIPLSPIRGPHNHGLANIYPWLRWDSFHYISIATHWYQATRCGHFVCGNSAWFPLYPVLIRIASFVTSIYWAPLFVSLSSFILLSFIWCRLIQNRWSWLAVGFAFFFLPSGIYLTAGFPISLALLLQALVTLTLLEQRRFSPWLFAFLGGLTYPSFVLSSVGIFPLLRWKPLDSLKSLRSNLTSLIIFTAPLQGYVFTRDLISRSTLIDNAYHLTVMRYGFDWSIDFPVLRSSIRYFYKSPIYLQTAIVFFMTLLCIIIACQRWQLLSRLDISIYLFSIAVWFPPHLFSDSISIYRQEAFLAPLFILVGSRLPRRILYIIAIPIFGISLSIQYLFFKAILV